MYLLWKKWKLVVKPPPRRIYKIKPSETEEDKGKREAQEKLNLFAEWIKQRIAEKKERVKSLIENRDFDRSFQTPHFTEFIIDPNQLKEKRRKKTSWILTKSKETSLPSVDRVSPLKTTNRYSDIEKLKVEFWPNVKSL